VSVSSASRSRLAALYSGLTGFDVYARAVSDAYQDLFGEGIFTGKGIYDVSAFHQVLNHRFPRNALLSHDLIEGAYARAGLVSDIEVIDDYPSHYSAHMKRKHRWVRGDWQILRWLFNVVPDEYGRLVVNPISTISRWKILDNLRRSMVEPIAFLLFVFGWFFLPGGALYWTIAVLLVILLPGIVQLGFNIGRGIFKRSFAAFRDGMVTFFASLAITLQNLIFLPHHMLRAFSGAALSLWKKSSRLGDCCTIRVERGAWLPRHVSQTVSSHCADDRNGACSHPLGRALCGIAYSDPLGPGSGRCFVAQFTTACN
jgi:cyclic beta-1,2-glucan synthetase